jgi:hypothetical protein
MRQWGPFVRNLVFRRRGDTERAKGKRLGQPSNHEAARLR